MDSIPKALALSDEPSSADLVALGWDSWFAEHFEPYAEQGFDPARVALEYNQFYRLYTGRGELVAETAGRLRHQALSRSDLPAVGDWVATRVHGNDQNEQAVRIHAVLPRRTRFSRKVAGSTTEEQIVAANVDTVFLVTALDLNYSLRRIERYLMLAWESGANPIIVLNKADLSPDPLAAVREVESIAFDVPVHAISLRTDQGFAVLDRYLRPSQTVALLGPSGVGKSTLINRLLGRDLQRTSEVREADQRGRHTTTHRELIVLPGRGLLMDTPGMRELQLWDVGEGSETSFADVEALGDHCRFADCQHRDEPGCAVKQAIAEGRLEPARLENYRKLQKELEHLAQKQDRRAQITARKKIKSATRAFNKHQPRD